ncbi:MAG TPA: glycosyltransferase [Bryobacteraceae bacterium]|nr:glycosyltransferase [Bryobacteraceae bacterium]
MPSGTIWHVIGSLDPSRGGTTAAVAEISSRLAKRGHPTRILAGAAAGSIESDLAHWDRLRAAGVRLDIEAASGVPLRSPALTKRISDSVKSGDVVHFHGVWEGLLWDAARVAERAGVSYMVCPHGMLDRWCRARSRFKKAFAWNLGARHFVRRAGIVHCLTEHDRVETQEVCGPAPVRIIPTGVDPTAFPVREARSGPPRPLEILYLGRVHPKKGLDVLLEAFASMNHPAALKIAGPSDDAAFESRCRAIVSDRNLASRVRWLGPLLGERKLAAFRSSDVFVLPSWQEGLSIAVLEALACALPVVLSEQCHFPEVGHHRAGFVAPNEAQAVAASLDTLAAMDEASRREMGAAGRRLVETSYSWDSIVNQLEIAYSELGYQNSSSRGRSRDAVIAVKSAPDASRS